MGNGVLATDYVGLGNKAERSTGLTGAVDSSKLTISLWFLIPVGISAPPQFFYNRIRGAAIDNIAFIPFNNSVRVLMKNDLGAPAGDPFQDIVLNMSSMGGITLGVWHHMLASWRTVGFAGVPLFNMYIDDVESLVLGPNNKIIGSIDHTTAPHTIAGSNSGSLFEYGGCMSEFYFNSTEFIDFSITSNRRLFIDGSGNPVELGSDGSLPTGTAPIIYLPDGASTTNAGTGGDFVQQGSIAACVTIPGLIPALTPRDIIEIVRDEIDAAKVAETEDDFLRLRLGFAESFLTDALSKFDDGDLRKTAKGVRKAVKFLELAVEKGFDAVTILDWGDRLCGAIRTIASDEIDAAIARTGDPVKIAEAQDVFADGELEKLFDEFLSAINDFEKAIKSATVA